MEDWEWKEQVFRESEGPGRLFGGGGGGGEIGTSLVLAGDC